MGCLARHDPPHNPSNECSFNFDCIHELPIIMVKVEDKLIRVLLDSGASINVISRDIANTISSFSKVSSPGFQIQALTGINIDTSDTIQGDILIQDTKFNVNFLVAQDPLSPRFQAILGLQFLKQYNFILDFKREVLKNDHFQMSWSSLPQVVNSKDFFLTNYVNNESKIKDNEVDVNSNISCNNTVDVDNFSFGILASKIKLAPKSQTVIEVRCKENFPFEWSDNTVYIEPNEDIVLDSCFIAKSISNLNNKTNCKIQILNTSDSPIVLNKNTRLVKIFPLNLVHGEFVQVNNIDTQEDDTDFDSWGGEIDISHLQGKDKELMQALLKKYNRVFAKSLKDLGCCDIIQHRIQLTDNIPVRQKPYKVPYKLKGEMKSQLLTLIEAGIIQPSTSSYAAPVLLVKKNDGSYRLVADLRKLNEKTLPDNYPIPNLQEMLDMLSGATYFSTIDLVSGFHQMQMHPHDAHLTGIATDLGVFQYNRLPFGLRNASSSFQRLLSIVLSGLSDLSIGVYIDDIVVASKTFAEHLHRLELVFKRLEKANLKLKPSKCSLAKREITYLGHRVSEGKVMPDPKNVSSIKNAEPPKTRKQVRSFLGLTGFYRKFIPNYAEIALPLTNLTKESVKFNWSEAEQDAFVTLKDFLIKDPCLKLPDFSQPFALFTDASKFHIGAVLSQFVDNFPHSVCFASRKLNPAEVNYSVFEKEALAIVFGINHFKQYLYGQHFTVFCDQKSLSHVFKLKDSTSRIARWKLNLQQYSFDIVYKPGRQNLMADYLSRCINHIETQPIQFNLENYSKEELIKLQQEDVKCKAIVNKINQGLKFSDTSPKFFLQDNLLLCSPKGKSRNSSPKLVVPRVLIQTILSFCHDNPTNPHAGFSRTLFRVRENFYWAGQYKNVLNYVKTCHDCISRRGFEKNKRAPLQKIPVMERPFQKTGLDVIGPVVTTNNGNKYVIAISDYFTRYPEAYAVPDIKGSTVTKCLIDFISRHGVMEVLYSDRGSNFLSAAMKEVYEKLGISKQHTVSYAPQSSGLIERFNKSFVDTLSHLISETQENWDEMLPFALLAFRTAFHRTLKEKPSYLVYGRDLQMPYHVIFSDFRTYADTHSYAEDLIIKLQTAFKITKQNLEAAADFQVESTSNRPSKNIKIGDIVYLHTPAIKPHRNKKFAKLNSGPFRVSRQQSPVLFEIYLISSPLKKQLVHVNRLIKVPPREIYPSYVPDQPQPNISDDNIPDNDVSVPTQESELSTGSLKTIEMSDPLWQALFTKSAVPSRSYPSHDPDPPVLDPIPLPPVSPVLQTPSSPTSVVSPPVLSPQVSPTINAQPPQSSPHFSRPRNRARSPRNRARSRNPRYNLRARDPQGFVKK